MQCILPGYLWFFPFIKGPANCVLIKFQKYWKDKTPGIQNTNSVLLGYTWFYGIHSYGTHICRYLEWWATRLVMTVKGKQFYYSISKNFETFIFPKDRLNSIKLSNSA